MGSSQSVVELVAAAQINAKAYEKCISDSLKQMDGQALSDTQVEEVRMATTSLEIAAVDTFSIFEARMQHHFRRGPFSRKLKSLLLKSDQADLAQRVHHYYLVINVLKHGKGASYRELLNTPTSPFVLKPSEDILPEDAPLLLIDVRVPDFFDGLTKTLLEAYHFLENRPRV